MITDLERNSNENMLYTDGNNEYKVELDDSFLMWTHIILKIGAGKLYDELC